MSSLQEMSSEEAIIRDIRENYLINDELGAESERVRRGVENLHKTTSKAVERLSGELYAKNSHFILELLQNADDNQYEADVKPSLRLIWDDARQAIEIRNNERGFVEKNVRALCAIGDSTKTDASEGYIGEKGIGFKSVFKVADRVYIASNGYRFVFDASRPLGMIVPQWVAEGEFPTTCEDGWTVFFLSLKVSIDRAALKQQFQELHRYLLLFLRKVRRLELNISGKREVFERMGELPIVTIWHSTGHQAAETFYTFLVHEQEYSKPPEVDEKKRPNATQTKITIAFPLETDPDGNPVEALQDVYAFLPLRSYGFKFVIQADFLLSTSREDVIEDNVWNKFIRNNIPDAFIRAAALFKDSQHISRQISLVSYIPWPDSITNEFFRSVATEIVDRLRTETIILSCDGKWHTPNTIFSLPNKLLLHDRAEDKKHEARTMTALIPNGELFRILHGEYIHDRYRWTKHASLLLYLGCKKFDFPAFVACLDVLDFSYTKPSIQWYQTVTDYIAEEHYKWSDNISLSYLARLNIYVTQNEKSTALFEGGHFFFPPKDNSFPMLDKSLLFMHPDSLTASSYKFLSSLKVKYPRPGDLAEAILALYARIPNIRSVRSQNELLVHVAFLLRNVDSLSNEVIKKIRSNLLLLDDNDRYVTPSQLYIKAKWIGYDLKYILPPTMSAINDQYISLANGDVNLEQKWVSFLTANCGVNRAIPLNNGSLPSWLVKKLADDSSGKIGINLLAMMAIMWREVYEPVVQNNQKAFCKELGNMRVPCIGGEVAQLRQTALPTSKIQSIFSNLLIYVDVEDPDNKKWNFLKYLDVAITVDVHTALKVLEGMSNRQENNIKAAETLYKFLDVHFNEAPGAIRDSFESKSLIAVKGHAENSVAWRKSADVLWDGDKNVFCDEPFLVDSLPQCEAFFVMNLRLRSAEVFDLNQMMSRLPMCSDSGQNVDNRNLHMAHVYQYLSSWIRKTTLKKKNRQWFNDFIKTPIFWVKTKNKNRVSFVNNSGKIFIEDNTELADLFRGTLQVLSVPRNSIFSMKEFIDTVTPLLRRLSNIKPDKIHYAGDLRIDEAWTDVVRKCIPLCARVLHCKHSENWDSLVSQRVFELANSHLTVWRVDTIIYTYAIEKVRKELPKKVAMQRDTTSIDIWISNKLDDDDAEIELGRLICDIFDPNSAELARLLTFALKIPMNLTRLEKYAQTYDILELPITLENIFGDASGILAAVKKNSVSTQPAEPYQSESATSHQDKTSAWRRNTTEKWRRNMTETDTHSSFGDQRSSFGDQRSSFGDQRSSFGDQRSSFGDQRSSFGDQRDMSQAIYDPSHPFLPNEREAHLAGVLGETFVYEHYNAILPGFGLGNWVSHLRNEYIASKGDGFSPTVSVLDIAQTDLEVECDFVYKDIYGVLGRLLGLPAMLASEQRIFFLEVKATTAKGSDSFSLSSREWMCAQRLSSFESKTADSKPLDRVYVIVRVENVKIAPSIVKVLIDPWALWKHRGIDLEAKDWVVSRFMGLSQGLL